MTAFTPNQLANARLLAYLTDQYPVPAATNNPKYRLKFAVIVAAFTESSLGDLNYGDAGSTSVGFFQQTNGYGTLGARMNPVTALEMFLNGGPQSQTAFLKTTWEYGDYPSICRCVQQVQKSQFNGTTVDPKTGQPYPLAGNYIGNINVAIDVLGQIGIPQVAPPTLAAQLAAVDTALTTASAALHAIKAP